MKCIGKKLGCVLAATLIVQVTQLFAQTGNTMDGAGALFSLTTGSYNSAFGFLALSNNTSGSDNTAVGAETILSAQTAAENTAVGFQALENVTSGGGNTAVGYQAMNDHSTGKANAAFGAEAMFLSTTGSFNTAGGVAALEDVQSGSNNVALGYSAGSSIADGNYNIDIGNTGVSGDSEIIRLGSSQTNLFVAGVYGITAASGVEVYVNSNGQLGTATSSRKYKDDIQTMGDSSDVLLSLHPVTFKYKHELDPQGIPQYGLVAEDVEKVDPGLVAHDTKGQPYTVRYGAINAMLLNEFLKEHRTVTDLQRKVDQLEKLVQTISSKN